jgi:hypothetical protein
VPRKSGKAVQVMRSVRIAGATRFAAGFAELTREKLTKL